MRKRGEGGGGWGCQLESTRHSRFRHHMRHVAPLSPVVSVDCAYFSSPQGCTQSSSTFHESPLQFRVSVANPMFSAACRLFVVSLRSFLHSLPLFSLVCSLFSQNAGGGVSRMHLRDTRE